MKTRRQQLRDIGYWLHGIDEFPDYEIDYDLESIVSIIERGGEFGLHNEIAATNDEQRIKDIETILSHNQLQPGTKYQSLADISGTLPPPEWFWRGWIQRGLVTLLMARPGVGKTYFALDLAKRVIEGEEAPDGNEIATRSNRVIYVDAEDFISEVNRRVEAWGLDKTKFFPIVKPTRDLIDYNKQSYQDELIEMATDLNPDLIIIDSLSGVNSKGENKVEEMRDILAFFAELAKETNCALLLVHHLRKLGANRAFTPVSMEDGRGSGHLAAVGRNIIAMDKFPTTDPNEENGPKMLKVLKTNVGKIPPALSISFEDTRVPDVAQLEYAGVNQILNGPTITDRVQAWLIDALKDEPKTYKDLIEEMQAKFDCSETVLQRAREGISHLIEDTVGKQRRGNKWQLVSAIQ